MNKQTGFTLIELMIAVVIIGVLVSFAFTSYQNSVRKSNRAEAKTAVSEVAQKLQRCFSMYGSYNNSNCAIYAQLSAAGGKITTQTRGFYDVTGVFTSSTYTLTATAVKLPQTADDGCNVMTLKQTGAKSPVACW